MYPVSRLPRPRRGPPAPPPPTVTGLSSAQLGFGHSRLTVTVNAILSVSSVPVSVNLSSNIQGPSTVTFDAGDPLTKVHGCWARRRCSPTERRPCRPHCAKLADRHRALERAGQLRDGRLTAPAASAGCVPGYKSITGTVGKGEHPAQPRAGTP